MVRTDKLVEIMVVVDSEVAHASIGDLEYGIWGTQIEHFFDRYGVEGKDNLVKFISERAIPEIERWWSRRTEKAVTAKEETEIDRLAAFLMANYQGEFGKGPKPGEGESAVDMAIRILGRTQGRTITQKPDLKGTMTLEPEVEL